MFGGGSGGANSPYTINCTRHLKNIKYARSSYYKVLEDISYSGTWVPIAQFDGVLDFNSHSLTFSNNAIPVNANYGFINVNNGEIKSGTFVVDFTTLEGSSGGNYYIGIVCAVNNGIIDSCFIEKTNSNDIYIKDWYCVFGAITGLNKGEVSNCENYTVIRGNCVNFGGIVGYNDAGGTIYASCSNRVQIYAETRGTISASVGGIVGLDGEGSPIEQPTNSGALLFDCNTSNSRVTIYMEQIAGRMCKADQLINPIRTGSATIKFGVICRL